VPDNTRQYHAVLVASSAESVVVRRERLRPPHDCSRDHAVLDECGKLAFKKWAAVALTDEHWSILIPLIREMPQRADR
jgi:hypothetical protein